MSGAVLVTGATTPLGRALVERLLADDSVSGVLAAGIEAEADFEPHARLAWHQADLTRARAIRRLMFGPGRECATVVHAAAHRSAHAVGERVHRLNVESTRLLLRLCEQGDTVRRFVYRSSAAVYSVRSGLPDVLREDAPLDLDLRGRQDRARAGSRYQISRVLTGLAGGQQGEAVEIGGACLHFVILVGRQGFRQPRSRLAVTEPAVQLGRFQVRVHEQHPFSPARQGAR